MCIRDRHSAPAVVECAVALTQGDSHLLEVELVSQLLGNALVALSVQLAAVDVGSLSLDAEHVLCVLLVGDADVNVLEMCIRDRPCTGAGPHQRC